LDFQLIVDPVVLMEYICKYTAKPEKASQQAVAIFQRIASAADDTSQTLTLLRKAMLQMSGARDYGAPEIAFSCLHLPFVMTNLTFESVNLTGSTLLDLDGFQKKRKLVRESLFSVYCGRVNLPFVNNVFLTCKKSEFVDMNFRDFAYRFKVVANKLKLRPKIKTNTRLVLRFFPSPRPQARGKNYDKHCMYQLIKYLPWQNSSDTIILPYLETQPPPETDADKECLISDAWKFTYESFLKTPRAKQVIPCFENEIRQSLYDVRVRHEAQHVEFDDEDDNVHYDDWMTILKNLRHLDSSVSVVPSWEKSLFVWSQQIIDEIPTWLDTQKKLHPNSFHLTENTSVGDERKCSNCFCETPNSRSFEQLSDSSDEMKDDDPVTRDDVSGMCDHVDEICDDVDEMCDDVDEILEQSKERQPSTSEKKPTRKQQFVLDIVQNQLQKLTSSTVVDPLRMLVLGTAGSGKSFLIKRLQLLLGNYLSVCATTGAAGVLIGGSTLHSLLKLPVRSNQKRPIEGNALRRLQADWNQFQKTPKLFLIIDEISMLGKSALYWVDQRLRQATCKNELFGGVSVLFFGDFGQLFPVRDTAMFLNEVHDNSVEKSAATFLYQSFADVVILDENLRAKDPVFKDMLLRIRNGVCTDDDYQLLKTRFATQMHVSTDEISCFDDSIRLFYRKKDAFDYNLQKLLSLNQPIARFDAANSDATAKRATTDVCSLPSTIVLAIGASVMITSNLWQTTGIFNGLTGKVYDILYDQDSKPPNLPLAVIVQASSEYTGPSLLPHVPRLIAITPLQISFSYRSKSRWRKQLPLMLAWARTIHKSQGMTLPRAVVDIGQRENAAGLTFVALSRVQRLSDLLLIPFSEERFKKIGQNCNLKKRLCEDKRLEALALQTERRYAHLLYT
jgi:ElaB/YqjD/DUF883 family membrane-anchored ribosome-binding protein